MRQRQPSSQNSSTGSSQAAPPLTPDKGGSAKNQQRQEGGDAQAAENSASESMSPTRSENPETDDGRKGQPQTSNAQSSEELAGTPVAAQSGSADPMSNRPNNADQARADVAPSADSATPAQPDGQTRPTDSSIETSGATANHPPTAPMSEQQLALEQWLRQVPDDPAGLLRRKFMVEHLLRKKRRPGQ